VPLLYFLITLMSSFHQNYYFIIFDKHQPIDLVKKNCFIRLGSDKRKRSTKQVNFFKILENYFIFPPQHHADDRFPTKC
jgi:hypothetical protein